jgi:uncharacterized membrane protein
MSLRFLGLMDFLREYVGRILIGLGLVLIVVGIMALGTFYFSIPGFAVVPILALFLGQVFVVYGFFIQVGLFSGRWRSINGLGTVLLCLSVACFAMAVVAIQIQLVTGFEHDVVFSHSSRITSTMFVPISLRPFLFLFDYGLELGTAFFVASLVLKLISFFKGY